MSAGAERIVVIESQVGLAERDQWPGTTIFLTPTKVTGLSDLKRIARQMTPDRIVLLQPGQEPHELPVEVQEAA